MPGGRPVSPHPPFSRQRVTTGLVSMKSTKIELASESKRPEKTLSLHTNPSQTPRLVNTISASPVPRPVLSALPLFSPSRPRRALVRSAPVRGFYHKEWTDPRRQPALLSHPPVPCSVGSLNSKRIIQILSAFNCRFLEPNTRSSADRCLFGSGA